MSPLASSASVILSLGTILCQIAVVVLAALALRGKNDNPLADFAAKRAVPIAFLVALAATLGSFFYSGVVGFVPCALCWYQRICLFPQVIILGIASVRKDKRAAEYGIALSAIGALLALYNYYIQFGGSPFISCGAGSGETSCAIRYFVEFGYITIPMMSFTVFALLLALFLLEKRLSGAPAPAETGR